MSTVKLNYCDWKKCGRREDCTTRWCGETCYTLYGVQCPEHFDDYICYLEVDNH